MKKNKCRGWAENEEKGRVRVSVCCLTGAVANARAHASAAQLVARSGMQSQPARTAALQDGIARVGIAPGQPRGHTTGDSPGKRSVSLQL